jgi:hypothetical protein
MFQKELDFFIKNQESLVAKYNGKILVLKEEQVVGVFDNILDAYHDSLKKFEPGSFMLQPCKPGPDAYTATISTAGVASF